MKPWTEVLVEQDKPEFHLIFEHTPKNLGTKKVIIVKKLILFFI